MDLMFCKIREYAISLYKNPEDLHFIGNKIIKLFEITNLPKNLKNNEYNTYIVYGKKIITDFLKNQNKLNYIIENIKYITDTNPEDGIPSENYKLFFMSILINLIKYILNDKNIILEYNEEYKSEEYKSEEYNEEYNEIDSEDILNKIKSIIIKMKNNETSIKNTYEKLETLFKTLPKIIYSNEIEKEYDRRQKEYFNLPKSERLFYIINNIVEIIDNNTEGKFYLLRLYFNFLYKLTSLRPKFMVDNFVIYAGGLLIYKVDEDNKIWILMIKSKGSYEDFGGKVDIEDKSIIDTVIRESSEESNNLLDSEYLREKITKGDCSKLILDKCKYILYIVKSSENDLLLRSEDFGDKEEYEGIYRTVEWVDIELIIKKELDIHPRLKFYEFRKLIIDTKNKELKNKNNYREYNNNQNYKNNYRK